MIESDPCPEQRALMQSLGFTIQGTEDSNISVWRSGPIVMRFGSGSIPTAPVVVGHLIQDAIAVGEQRRADAIAKLLK